MKKTILLLLLLVSTAFSAINECKTDIYFGNGILTKRTDAIYNTFEILEPSIRKEIYHNNEDEMYKHIGKVEEAYNHTDGMLADLLESFVQKTDGTGIEYLNIY